MRVVIDTNVLVSAALKLVSTPALAVRAVEQGGILLKSAATERQLFEVVARPYFLPLIGHETQAWLQTLMSGAELITITERIADLIVSDDADLLALSPFRGIAIVTPAAFVQGRRQ